MQRINLIIVLAFMGVSSAYGAGRSALETRFVNIEKRLDALERQIANLSGVQSVEEPLDHSQFTDSEVLNWAKRSLEEIYSYNYENYRAVLARIQRNFTDPGFTSYTKALDESKNLQEVEAKKITVSGRITGFGKILEKGVVNDRYTWEVELPILVSYKTAAGDIKQELSVKMQIVRVKYVRNPHGISINSVTASLAQDDMPQESEGDATTEEPSAEPVVAPESTPAPGSAPQ